MCAFVLVSSPLGGADSWQGVAAELRERGIHAVVAEPALDEDDPEPLWSQQATAVAAAARLQAGTEGLVLVGHSGATAILPAAGDLLDDRVTGYILVDGPIPEDGRSHLDLMRAAMPALAGAVERTLAAGRPFPDERAQAASSRLAGRDVTATPRGSRFFMEPIRVGYTWPGAPCACVVFGDSPGPSGVRAEDYGWTIRVLSGNHFLLLSEAGAVADVLMELAQQMGLPTRSRNQ
jgi:pimeloyl-ACP methyl ester carboxylesterase